MFELMFIFGMIINLLKDFISELDDTKPVTDLEDIIRHNLYSWSFVCDVITLIPMTQIFSSWKFCETLYVVKLYRGMSMLKYLNIKTTLKHVQDTLLNRSIERAKRDPLYAEDTLNDNNRIVTLRYIYYFLKVSMLIVLILNISYFGGLSWVIVSKIEEDLN